MDRFPWKVDPEAGGEMEWKSYEPRQKELENHTSHIKEEFASHGKSKTYVKLYLQL